MANDARTSRSFSLVPSKAKAATERARATGNNEGSIIRSLLMSLKAWALSAMLSTSTSKHLLSKPITVHDFDQQHTIDVVYFAMK